MPIAPGTPAPDFTLKTQDEKDWTLASHRGKRVVLLWYPLDWSPTCEKENCRLGRDVPIVTDARTEVVGISRDSTWSHRAFKAAKGIQHDLLADPLLVVTKQYGLQHPAVPFISHRATVIIDSAGRVAWVQVQDNTREERDWAAVQVALAKAM
jgi:peroxiredoxin